MFTPVDQIKLRMSHRHKNKFALRVKRELLARGITVAAVARELGRPRSTVSRSIHSAFYPRVRDAVSRFLFS